MFFPVRLNININIKKNVREAKFICNVYKKQIHIELHSEIQ